MSSPSPLRYVADDDDQQSRRVDFTRKKDLETNDEDASVSPGASGSSTSRPLTTEGLHSDAEAQVDTDPDTAESYVRSADTEPNIDKLPQALRRKYLRHYFLLGALVAVYGSCLLQLDAHHVLMSAAWREIMGELHPDSPKDAERITEAEVVPKWAEFLHADDTTKQLNWFQTFCRDKFGMDDHLEFYWTCNMLHADVDFDPHDSRRALEPNMNCSKYFMSKHVEKGDDPRCVPHGSRSLELLQRKLELNGEAKGWSSSGVANLSLVPDEFDEYTVREGSPLFEALDDKFESVVERLNSVREALAGQQDEKKQPGLSKGTANARRLHRWNDKLMVEKERKKTKWRPLWQRALKHLKNRTKKEQIGCPMLEDGCNRPGFEDVDIPEVPCYCFQEVTRENKHIKGEEEEKVHVTTVCRNHHWGLMHLCKPKQIEVVFLIDRLQHRSRLRHLYNNQSTRVGMRTMWFMVTMTFTELAGGADYPSGWYRAQLDLKEGQYYGFKQAYEGVIAICTLVLLLSTIIYDFTYSMLMTPTAIRNMLKLKRRALRRIEDDVQPSGDDGRLSTITSQVIEVGLPSTLPGRKAMGPLTRLKLQKDFQDIFFKFIDARGDRRQFMTLLPMIVENFAALFAVLGFMRSLGDYYTQLIPPPVEGVGKLIPARDYIWAHCSGFNLITESLYELFFDDLTFHCLAWGVLYLDLMFFIMGRIHGLRWLPNTLTLAAVKMAFFSVAYSAVLIGFAVLCLLQFGPRYVQFNNLHRSIVELFLLSVGVQGTVFDDMYPFQEDQALEATIYLGVFLVIFVVIGMNFFVTILLDAYNIALDKEAGQAELNSIRSRNLLSLMHTMGFPVDEQNDSDDDQAQHLPTVDGRQSFKPEGDVAHEPRLSSWAPSSHSQRSSFASQRSHSIFPFRSRRRTLMS